MIEEYKKERKKGREGGEEEGRAIVAFNQANIRCSGTATNLGKSDQLCLAKLVTEVSIYVTCFYIEIFMLLRDQDYMFAYL